MNQRTGLQTAGQAMRNIPELHQQPDPQERKSCHVCGKPYKTHHEDNYLGTGLPRDFQVPDCNCIQHLERERDSLERINTRMKEGGFPDLYLGYTFKSFTGDTACRDLARRYTQREHPGIMLLVGRIGAGKTSLAVSACWELAARGNVLYAYAYDILTNGVQLDHRLEELRRLDQFKTLVIDEIGLQINTDPARDFMERLLIGRNDYGLNTILISNQEAKEFEALIGQRAWDRAIKQGMVVPFKGPNLRGE